MRGRRLAWGVLLGLAVATSPVAAEPGEASCPAQEPAVLGDEAFSGSLGHDETICLRLTVAPQDPRLIVTMTGPAGPTADLDLYVRYGDRPTAGAFDCRPFTGTSTETCTLEAPAVGDWFVMVHAFGAGGDFAISVSGGCISLTSHVPVEATAAPSGAPACYTIEVPEGTADLTVAFPAPGPDVYVLGLRHGAAFDGAGPVQCQFYWARQCTARDPEPGIWFIGVRGPNTGTVQLAAYLLNGCVTVREGSNVMTEPSLCYSIDVPAGVDLARFRTTGAMGVWGSPDADPDLSWCLFRSSGICAIPGPAGRLYLHLWYPVFPAFTVDIDFEQAIDATGTVVDSTPMAQGDGRLYRFAGSGRATLMTLQASSDLLLLAARGAPPTGADIISTPQLAGPRCANYQPVTYDAWEWDASAYPSARVCSLPAGDGAIYAFVRPTRVTEVYTPQGWVRTSEYVITRTTP